MLYYMDAITLQTQESAYARRKHYSQLQKPGNRPLHLDNVLRIGIARKSNRMWLSLPLAPESLCLLMLTIHVSLAFHRLKPGNHHWLLNVHMLSNTAYH